MTMSPPPERRTILVTGGTGTLGRELVARFVCADDTAVVVLTRAGAQGRAAIPAGVRALVGDVRHGPTLGLSETDRATLHESITDIVHCAADTTFNRPLADARATNVTGTEAVLGFARDCR